MQLWILCWISSNLFPFTGGGRAINALSCLSWKIVLEARNERTWVLGCTSVKQDFFPWDGTWRKWLIMFQMWWTPADHCFVAVILKCCFLFLCVERPFLCLFLWLPLKQICASFLDPRLFTLSYWKSVYLYTKHLPTPVSCWYHIRTPRDYVHPITRLCFWWMPFDPAFS